MYTCLYTDNYAYRESWNSLRPPIFAVFIHPLTPSSSMACFVKDRISFLFLKWALQMFKQLWYSCAYVCYMCPDQYSHLIPHCLTVQMKIVQMASSLLLSWVSSRIKIFCFEVWCFFEIRAFGVFDIFCILIYQFIWDSQRRFSRILWRLFPIIALLQTHWMFLLILCFMFVHLQCSWLKLLSKTKKIPSAFIA